MEDDKTAEVALEAGEIDFGRVSTASIQRYESSADVKLLRKPSLRYRWIGMNVENPKLQDINVRQAIRYALDVPGMVKATYMGQADVEYALIPPGLIGYWKDAPQYERDVAKAKEYMQKAAGVDSLDLQIDIQDTTEYRSWAEIAQQNLKDIGINLTINPMDSSAYWSFGEGEKGKEVELFSGNYSMQPDPSWATMWFTCAQVGVWNWERWCNKEYDELPRQGARHHRRQGTRGDLHQDAADLGCGRQGHLHHARRDGLRLPADDPACHHAARDHAAGVLQARAMTAAIRTRRPGRAAPLARAARPGPIPLRRPNRRHARLPLQTLC